MACERAPVCVLVFAGVMILHSISWQDPTLRICQDASPRKVVITITPKLKNVTPYCNPQRAM